MNIETQLKQHDLRITNVRKKIYQYFSDTNSAVSHAELELIFNQDFDRVTIYRTLNSFLEKGLLHKIPTDSGSARYALCHKNCSSAEHIDNHVHFKCYQCQALICLHEVEIPFIKLPANFKVDNAILMYEGICKTCNPEK
jgi:Fur family ferric uptake transcriptional regulator